MHVHDHRVRGRGMRAVSSTSTRRGRHTALWTHTVRQNVDERIERVPKLGRGRGEQSIVKSLRL